MENKNTEKEIWFKRKTYGWGWTPATWQGWVVTLVYVVLIASAVVDLDHESFKNILLIVLATIVLIRICYKKGQKPRWQWGERK